jgi:gliding motility-associated-like protein
MKQRLFIFWVTGWCIPAMLPAQQTAKLYPYDTLVAGVAGSGMTLTPESRGVVCNALTFSEAWATVTPIAGGQLSIEVTETNNHTGERTGYIEVKCGGSATERIVLLQPGKTCGKGTEGTAGRRFWVAFSENIDEWLSTRRAKLELIIASDQEASGTVGNPATGWTHPFTIAAGEIMTVPVPRAQAYNTDGETIAALSLLVESSAKISVYGNNFQPQSSDAANILPVEALGDEYYSLSYNANVGARGNIATPETFLIVATEDHTLVTIVPASETEGGKAAGNPYTIRMKKGETYLVKSKLGGGKMNVSFYKSITGSYIKANKPLAVFAGHKRAKIGCPGSNSRDHLYEQLFPLRLWGADYAVASTGQPRDLYRIVAAYDNTQITINGAYKTTLGRGGYADYEVAQGQCDVVKSSRPVSIALFSESMDCFSPKVTEGDPFMIVLNPVENEIRNIIYAPIPSSNIHTHYTNILVKTAVKGQTLLTDLAAGANVPLSFTDMAGSSYSFARVETAPNAHRLQNNAGFIAYAYGYGDAESYGYSVGARFNHMDYPPVPDTAYCLHEPFKPLAAYDTHNDFLWYASATSTSNLPGPPPFNTDTPGAYSFYVSRLIECSESPRKTVTITVRPPPAAATITSEGAHSSCRSSPVILTAHSPDAVTYQWHKDGGTATISASATCTAIASGSYAVVITDAHGCTATSGQTVTIRPSLDPPVITPPSPVIFCAGSPATLTAYSPDATSYTWYNNGSPNGTGKTCLIFVSGSYSVVITDARGCTATSGVTATMYPSSPPVITPSGATDFCAGGSVTLVASMSGATACAWYKDGTPTGNTSTSYTATATGSYSVLMTESHGCTATAAQIVMVNPLPEPVITPDGPTSFCYGGSVNLQAYSQYADGYAWYKDGGTATVGTSSVIRVAESGSYTVVATIGGCSATNGQNVTVNPLPVAPTLNIPYNICQHGGNMVFIATGYTGELDWSLSIGGAATGDSYTFDGATAGIKTALVRSARTYSNAPACYSATVSGSAAVNPLPATPTLYTPYTICQHGGNMVFIATGYSGTPDWSLSTGGAATGDSYTFNSATAGIKTVVVRSAQTYSNAPACYSATVSGSATVNPLPVAPSLNIPYNICQHGGNMVFIATGYTGELDWSLSTGGVATGDSYTFDGATAGTKTALARSAQTYSNAPACYSATVSGSATVNPLPAAPVITPAGPTSFCTGGSVTLAVNASGGTVFEWYRDGVLASNAPGSYVATTGGAYSVKITDRHGCTATSGQPVVVTVYPLPDAPAVTPSGATSFCYGGSALLTARLSGAVAYEWYRDKVFLERNTGGTYRATESGAYEALAVNSHDCRSAAAAGAPVRIVAYPLPRVPVIAASPDPPFYVGYRYTLRLRSPEAGVRYDWYLNGKYTGHSGGEYPLPVFQLHDFRVYSVEAMTGSDCRSATEMQATAEIPPLFIPNVFTPNNDGVDDRFQIAGLEAYVSNELQVLNKRGQVVFSAKNYHSEWDGGDQPTDVYFYYLTLTDAHGTISKHTGYVHIKRH